RDLVLPPRSQASGFGGTGLSEILRAKGIKNVAVAGFTSDVCVYATALSAYDLGFHVYALREGMVGFFDGMAEQMVNFVYPMWSPVIDNDEFDNMNRGEPGGVAQSVGAVANRAIARRQGAPGNARLRQALPVTIGNPAARHSGRPSSSRRALKPRARS